MPIPETWNHLRDPWTESELNPAIEKASAEEIRDKILQAMDKDIYETVDGRKILPIKHRFGLIMAEAQRRYEADIAEGIDVKNALRAYAVRVNRGRDAFFDVVGPVMFQTRKEELNRLKHAHAIWMWKVLGYTVGGMFTVLFIARYMGWLDLLLKVQP